MLDVLNDGGVARHRLQELLLQLPLPVIRVEPLGPRRPGGVLATGHPGASWALCALGLRWWVAKVRRMGTTGRGREGGGGRIPFGGMCPGTVRNCVRE